jgi:hypothetical protein
VRLGAGRPAGRQVGGEGGDQHQHGGHGRPAEERPCIPYARGV